MMRNRLQHSVGWVEAKQALRETSVCSVSQYHLASVNSQAQPSTLLYIGADSAGTWGRGLTPVAPRGSEYVPMPLPIPQSTQSGLKTSLFQKQLWEVL